MYVLTRVILLIFLIFHLGLVMLMFWVILEKEKYPVEPLTPWGAMKTVIMVVLVSVFIWMVQTDTGGVLRKCWERAERLHSTPSYRFSLSEFRCEFQEEMESRKTLGLLPKGDGRI
jgi:hypothetical protein